MSKRGYCIVLTLLVVASAASAQQNRVAAPAAASGLSPVGRAAAGLRQYREEMLHPTPAPRAPYTEIRTHDYAMAEITRKLLADKADVPTLKKTWEGLKPGEVKDTLTIFLALSGDAAAKDPVTAYVVDRSKPMRLRELAATAVGKLGVKLQDPKLADLLAQVLREDTQGQYKAGGKGNPKPVAVVYPVRRAAKAGIKAMEKAGMLLPSYVTQAAERSVLETKLPAAKSPGTAKPPAELVPGRARQD